MAGTVPEWLLKTEEYTAAKDSDGFLTKSSLSVLSVLSRIRETSSKGLIWASPSVMLMTVLLLIVLMAVSKNMLFSYIILAETLLASLFLCNKALARSVKTSLTAMLISLIILLPAALSGSPRTMLTVSVKVFTSVALLNLVSQVLPFNKITESLKAFHVPDLFIFTLDITIKYIVMLGDVCINMLNALKLRSVGKNRTKGKSLSGIDKALRGRLVPVVGVAVIPRHSPTPFHLLVLVAGIQRCRLRLTLSLVVASPTATTP